MSIKIKGYCLKFGETIASHAPVKSLMSGIAYLKVPFYIGTYKSLRETFDIMDGYAELFKRKDGVYCICVCTNSAIKIENIKDLKLGCFANQIKTNKAGDIIDGVIRYVCLNKNNIEEIESLKEEEE